MKKTFIAFGVLALIIGVLLIDLPYIYIPKEVTREFHVPQLQIIHNESFVVPPSTFVTRSIYLNAGDNLDIVIGVTS